MTASVPAPSTRRVTLILRVLGSLAIVFTPGIWIPPSLGLAANDATITAEARAQAQDIFESRCSACHGADGRGDGPAAGNLKPKPIDFHSRKWQSSVSDEKITRAIIYGGKAVGLSGQMAPNPDLESEPAVVGALVERIRKYTR